ncbi:MAG TPA: flagellar biosynthetic protein FliQ [Stellaceae bacterium]|nr:flagellar biosynthetic protein FliQ [Stellaceae bacterium]
MDPMSAAVNGALLTTVMVAGPFLAVVMAIGLVISLFQALTQINEMTLSFVPKFLGTALVLAVLGPWLLRALERFAVHIWGGFAGMLT